MGQLQLDASRVTYNTVLRLAGHRLRGCGDETSGDLTQKFLDIRGKASENGVFSCDIMGFHGIWHQMMPLEGSEGSGWRLS